MVTFRDNHGNIQCVDGQVWTGLRDSKGDMIFDGDRVHVYIPMKDRWQDGTVVWSYDDGEPSSFVVRLDTPYMDNHAILSGMKPFPVEYHYLEGGPSCYLLPPKEAK